MDKSGSHVEAYSPEPLAPLPAISKPSCPTAKSLPPSHPMQTKSKSGIFKPKAYSSTKHPLPMALLTSSLPSAPTCFSKANQDPAWQAAMSTEIDALMKRNRTHGFSFL